MLKHQSGLPASEVIRDEKKIQRLTYERIVRGTLHSSLPPKYRSLLPLTSGITLWGNGNIHKWIRIHVDRLVYASYVQYLFASVDGTCHPAVVRTQHSRLFLDLLFTGWFIINMNLHREQIYCTRIERESGNAATGLGQISGDLEFTTSK